MKKLSLIVLYKSNIYLDYFKEIAPFFLKFCFMNKVIMLFVLIVLLLNEASLAQEISINISHTRMALNEPFTISVEAPGQKIVEISAFPALKGFRKINVSSATSTLNLNGKVVNTYSRNQIYYPNQEGTYRIPSFSMRVNGQEVNFPGATVEVGPRDENKGDLVEFSFQDLFDADEERKFQELKEDAFIDIFVDKDEVYVGEGFHVMIAFYVSLENQAPMKFPANMGQQVEDISKQIKPSNCWEENFELTRMKDPVRLEINGKYYDQYIFYEATFFPLNSELIQIPRVQLEMLIKNKIEANAENPNEFGDESAASFKTFYSNTEVVRVKELPPHPLRDKVAVGNYYLQEKAPPKTIETGESFTYNFRIIGRGNISAIQSPKIQAQQAFDIYPPYSQQYIKRESSQVTGRKDFAFQMVPKESGAYGLQHCFEWIFFDPQRQVYDTLRPRREITIAGESLRNAEISSNYGDFYQQMENADRRTGILTIKEWVQLIVEILIFALLVSTAILMYRR